MPPKELRSGNWEAFVIVLGAAFFAVVGLGWTCWVRAWCLDAGTCRAVNESSIFPAAQCSFENVVPLVSDLLYHNASGSGNSLSLLTRGMCGVGERLHVSVITGRPECMLLRPYPDAMDYEVMQPSAATDHQRACGKWLAGGMTLSLFGEQYPEYLSFDDSDERAAAVRHAEDGMHAGSRLSAGNLGKFRAACQRAVLGGSAAVRAAGERAYDYLVNDAAINSVVDEATMLHSVGKLASHYCDGPVTFGWEQRVSGYRAGSRAGTPFNTNALAQALQLVNEPQGIQGAAEAGNKHVNAYAYLTPDASVAKLMTAYRAGTGRPSSEDGAANLGRYESVPELDGLIHLVSLGAAGSLDHTKGYLKGVAAMCAFSLSAIVNNPGYTATSAPEGHREKARGRRPPAAALGQLATPRHHEPLFEVERAHVLNASSITVSQLVGGDATDASGMCRDFTRLMFPDEIDAIHHELVISPTLYSRMQSMVADARAGVAHVLRNNNELRAALVDPDAIALDVENTRIRIPGAPRGSWAGATRSIPLAAFDSSDGVFVMAAKQARALWLDRQGSMVYDATDPCEGPSAYQPLTANAYIFPGYKCSYFLLGMSFRPYADEAYDDASLASRFGYIIAHELSHNNLNGEYITAGIDALLADYPCASTRDEGWADVAGCLGVLHTGHVNSDDLCQHVSQSWCARTPIGYGGCVGQTHPFANVRGNALCATLRRLGV
tara:strand:- start:7853 stop:10015 length:2163 start_codon:yes stop_codon:yes gene_type:complete